MEKGLAINSIMSEVMTAMPHLMKLKVKHIWMDYDEEADVLYVNFDRPQAATDSELLEDDVIVRYRDEEVIGLTILHTKTRLH